jgi:hypothetical protein
MPSGRSLCIVPPKNINWRRKGRDKVTDESHVWKVKTTNQLVYIVRTGYHGNVWYSEIMFKNGKHQIVANDHLSFVGSEAKGQGSLASLAQKESLPNNPAAIPGKSLRLQLQIN